MREGAQSLACEIEVISVRRNFNNIFTGDKYPHVEILILDYNLFQDLYMFGEMPSLRHLSMTNNVLTSIYKKNTKGSGLNALKVDLLLELDLFRFKCQSV
jgi:hypothetical protein